MSPHTDTDPTTQSPETNHLPRQGERRQRREFRFIERRTGFDRRRRYPMTDALRERPWLLALVLVVMNTLSAIDFALTRVELDAGVASEGNPVLTALFEQGPAQAWIFKTSVMLLVSIGIWHARRHRVVLLVAIGGLVLYALLIVYHLLGMRAAGII